ATSLHGRISAFFGQAVLSGHPPGIRHCRQQHAHPDTSMTDASAESGAAALAAVNHAVVAEGETLPAVRLQDGTRVQTGTVAALLDNVRRYDAGERGAVEEAMALAVPTLFKVGLFDLFPPQEWMRGGSAGRRLVGA